MRSQFRLAGLAAPRGERHFRTTLKDDDIRQIRALAANGVLKFELSRTYGVCQSTIGDIVNRVTWFHVP